MHKMSERQFKCSTGYSRTEFDILLKDFTETFEQKYNCTYEYYINEHLQEDVEVKLVDLFSCLFFVLYKYKNDLIYDSLGAAFSMGRSTAYDNFKKYSALLEKTLQKKKGIYPKREFDSPEEFEQHLQGEKEIIFDGTENEIERPQNADRQKDAYSGKKKTHTDVAMVLSNKNRHIYYVSYLYEGKANDMGIFKTEFEPDRGWFKNLRVLFDLGFVGVNKLYEFKDLVIGHKRSRKSKKNPKPELTPEQKEKNKAVSKERIYVEHAIGGMKRYRILKNKARTKSYKLKNQILGNCAALWNYKIEINAPT